VGAWLRGVAWRRLYKEMFKPSANCRAPHVNVDALRDELHRARAVDRLAVQSADELLSWLLRENNRLSERPASEWGAKAGAKALAKAEANKFFLGMDSSWIRHGALRDAVGEDRGAEDEE
jgi:hypothetical protein